MNLSVHETKNLCSGKKRSLSIDKWKDKKLKSLRNAGQEYINKRGKGVVVPAKQCPTQVRGCSEQNCFKTGCKTLTLNYIHSLFNKFYTLDYNGQSAFLAGCIKIREPLRRRADRSDATSQKLAAFDYNINGKPICLKTLINTFSISLKRVRVLQEKLKMGDLIPQDNRGKHLNRPHAVNNNVRQKVIEHIASFPTIENHYSRKDSLKKCLSMDLSVKKMHRIFLEKYPECGQTTYSEYRKIFNSNFKLRFGTPRSDTCKQCDLFYGQLIVASSEDERKKIQQDSVTHHMKADAAYKYLNEDSKNKNQITISVDLQQVLFTPMLTHSDIYYQRQYSSYNLAVNNMTENVSNMFLWHEVIAKRGSKEVASCLLKYVTNTFNVLAPTKERRLIVWSDRCVGQNNNKFILTLYHYLIRSRYFSEIHQKFMITGHSFLPCDRDFALIERQRRKSKALVPEDWKYVISSSKITSPFTITEMKQEDFKDIETLTQKLMVKSTKFQITKYVWFKLSQDDLTSVYARDSHNVIKPWKIFQLFNCEVELPDLPLLYNMLLPISEEKKKDLLTMIPFLTEENHKEFYKNLPTISSNK